MAEATVAETLATAEHADPDEHQLVVFTLNVESYAAGWPSRRSAVQRWRRRTPLAGRTRCTGRGRHDYTTIRRPAGQLARRRAAG